MLGYTEKHHIIPKCIGGNDCKNNLVMLTPEEHYLAHQLLVKIYPNNTKLVFAAKMMSVGHIGRRRNKLYGWLRRKCSEVRLGTKNTGASIKLRGNTHGKANAGKKKPNLSLRNKGNTYGKANAGKKKPPKTPEQIRKFRESMTGNTWRQQITTCPYCQKEGGVSNMKRWHFDNCKSKINTNNILI